MRKKICLTGGGTMGHISPNIVLADNLRDEFDIIYIGSSNGLERELIKNTMSYVRFYAISSGKLRRFMTWRNLLAPFETTKGVIDAITILHRERPAVVFASGGYVSFPTVLAAWILRISVTIYEADTTMGLANKLSAIFAKTVCTNSDILAAQIKRAVHVGPFIRKEFYCPNAEAVRTALSLSTRKPVLLVFGGSLGSKFLNDMVSANKEAILCIFQIIHVCGKGKTGLEYSTPEYKVIESIMTDFASYLALADMVISRAGASAIAELLFLKKPHILVPLSLRVSRGDQIKNAAHLQNLGVSCVIDEDHCTPQIFLDTLMSAWQQRDSMISAMGAMNQPNAAKLVTNLLRNLTSKKQSVEHTTELF